MARKVLNDKQEELIAELVTSNESITDILTKVHVPKSTYYKWKKENKVFNDALEEALDMKMKMAKQNVRSKVEEYLKILETKAKRSKNDNASVAAVKALLEVSNINAEDQGNSNKDDLTPKNRLMEMLKKKK